MCDIKKNALIFFLNFDQRWIGTVSTKEIWPRYLFLRISSRHLELFKL